MAKLDKDVFDTPSGLEKIFGKTIQVFEIAIVVVVVLLIANALGLG